MLFNFYFVIFEESSIAVIILVQSKNHLNFKTLEILCSMRIAQSKNDFFFQPVVVMTAIDLKKARQK